MLRKRLYSGFVKKFGKYERSLLFHLVARCLERLCGLTVFHYGGVKLMAGPVAYLDRYIIRGENINPLVTSAVTQYLGQGGVFLDIGANHGVLSLLAARNPNVHVFAFEPSSRELTRLWKNLSLNPKNSISVFSFGIGVGESKQEMTIAGSYNPGMNSLPILSGRGKRETCHFAALDQLLSLSKLAQTRVCKLDVEGQEMFILKALRPHMELLKKCVFVVEISPLLLPKVGFSAQDIYDFFAQVGFVPQYGQDPAQHQWDEIFYHPEHVPAPAYSETLN